MNPEDFPQSEEIDAVLDKFPDLEKKSEEEPEVVDKTEIDNFRETVRSKLDDNKIELDLAIEKSAMLNPLSEEVSKWFLKGETKIQTAEQQETHMKNTKLLLMEIVANVWNHDPNGEKRVKFEGTNIQNKYLKIIGRGGGPEIEKIKGAAVEKENDNVFHIHTGDKEGLAKINQEMEDHRRGFAIVAGMAEDESMDIEFNPHENEGLYSYTIHPSTPEPGGDQIDHEKIAA